MTTPNLLETFVKFDGDGGRQILSAFLDSTTLFESSTLRSYLYRLGHALLPSFIVHRASLKEQKLHKYAALDGLRGVACLFVFNEHFTYNFTHGFLYGYGIDGYTSMVQLPFLRLFFSGFAMVATFYVISGYVLSYKPLKQMRTRTRSSHFLETMASSIFRRALRLYLPVMVAVLLCGLCVWLGFFTLGREVWENPPKRMEIHEPPPPVHMNFSAQMNDTILALWNALFIWTWDDIVTPGDYDLHLWTIPVEFRCSMVLFLVLLGTSQLRQNIRLAVVFSSIGYCIFSGRKDLILFLAGMMLAEIDMIRAASDAPGPGSFKKIGMSDRAYWITMFILGLYIASAPLVGIKETWGYTTLASLVPRTLVDDSWAVQSVGAILTTWSIANCEEIQLLFTTSICQYLGKISFALYLVHGNILKALLYPMLPYLWPIMGGEEGGTTLQFCLGWLLGMVIILPLTLWMADVFWRMVDIPSVKFARWLESAATAPWSDDDRRGDHQV